MPTPQFGANLRECEDQSWFNVQAVPVIRFDWCKTFPPYLLRYLHQHLEVDLPPAEYHVLRHVGVDNAADVSNKNTASIFCVEHIYT
jgi:hypothetical protein